MSVITDDPEDSPRDCSRRSRKHCHGGGSSNRRRRALIAASSTVASLLSLAVILWLTLLRPSSPSFSLLAATATVATAAGNASSAVIIVDAALTAHNPNAHAAALYDRLHASASYGGVALGAGPPLPPLEQPDAGDQVLSATLTSSSSWSWSWRSSAGGGGRALLRVRIQGQLRWKVAAWVSGRNGVTVDCIATVMRQTPSAPGELQQQGSSSPSPSQCATHVHVL